MQRRHLVCTPNRGLQPRCRRVEPKHLCPCPANAREMWPWGHLAVAYLLYTVITHRRFGRPPRAVPAIALAFGSQTPDLIDKPLAWNFGILPDGRTLAHSLFVVALLVPVVLLVADRLEGRAIGVAFLIGYCSHLLADVPPRVLSGSSHTPRTSSGRWSSSPRGTRRRHSRRVPPLLRAGDLPVGPVRPLRSRRRRLVPRRDAGARVGVRLARAPTRDRLVSAGRSWSSVAAESWRLSRRPATLRYAPVRAHRSRRSHGTRFLARRPRGRAGRLDALCRSITAAFVTSHGIREDVRVHLIAQDELTITFDGGTLKRLNPTSAAPPRWFGRPSSTARTPSVRCPPNPVRESRSTAADSRGRSRKLPTTARSSSCTRTARRWLT